jgi:hypothetical protein
MICASKEILYKCAPKENELLELRARKHARKENDARKKWCQKREKKMTR